MTTTTMAPTPERLREEDFTPGRPFVHPDTKLEYADFQAYFCGKDPLPHWRNARIKEVLAHRGGEAWQHYHPTHAFKLTDAANHPATRYASWSEFFAARVRYFTEQFDRRGDPVGNRA